jgi:2-oxoglutarate dehydrogenase E2 component (dihydrolipoamide succinyltransferase)
MKQFEIVMPKLGESIIEATITRWIKNEGEAVMEDDALVEIATDKVDSEIPSPVAGRLAKVLFPNGSTVAVGSVIALIEMEGEAQDGKESGKKTSPPLPVQKNDKPEMSTDMPAPTPSPAVVKSGKFLSPLVRNMVRQEKITPAEIDSIAGTGKDGRITKHDIQQYLEDRQSGKIPAQPVPEVKTLKVPEAPKIMLQHGDKVAEMDRMRKLIADHMVMSKHVSPHVTSFIEVDVTNVVNWRNRVKDDFLRREKEKITYTPVFVEAAARALKDYPGVNASVDGYNIVYRKNINIGMATALPSGNLIVPVIKNADTKNLLGLAKAVNDLAGRARNNKLDPDDIQGGTFTITNFGTFGSLTGAPVINQPQVAILGIGVITKKPVVMETAQGDVIAIRHMTVLSLAYDHRAVDGALGGMFLLRVKEYLENFHVDTTL